MCEYVIRFDFKASKRSFENLSQNVNNVPCRLSPPNIKVIQSKNNVINIFHVSEAIYMLDDSGDLFEFVCANNEWSWKWVQHLDKGLAITG